MGTRTQMEGLATEHQFLVAGRQYRVLEPFKDHDGDVHPAGETWVFLGYAFAPYDDGLSLFVSTDGDQEWHIRMQCRPEQQGPTLDALSEYLAEPTEP